MGTFWCECCDLECEIASDDFTRTPTTNTGWLSPGTTGVSSTGAAWSNTDSVKVDDGANATASLAAMNWTQYLDCSNFGLAVPAGSIVTGMEVKIRRYVSGGSAKDATITLLGVNGEVGANRASTFFEWPAVETEVVYGGSTDHWGMFLTPAILNASTFAVRLSAMKGAAAGGTCNVDLIQIRVHYRTGGLGSGWSSITGSWGMANVAGNHCAAIEDPNSYLRFQTPHPASIAEHVVLVNLSTNQHTWKHGDLARIVLCGTLFAEIQFGYRTFSGSTNSGCTILRIYNGTTLLQETSPLRIDSSGTVAFWAGYSATTGILWAVACTSDGTLPTQVRVAENVGTVTGTYVGIGSGATVDGIIAFSDFHYYQHNYSDGSSSVTDCYAPGVETPPVCQFAYPWYHAVENAIPAIDCGWVIVSGTWDAVELGSNGAQFLRTADANALIECMQEQSEWNCLEYSQPGYHYAVSACLFDTAGDTARFYLDWDGTDGHYAELRCGAIGTGAGGVLSLHNSAGLLEQRDATIKPSEWLHVRLCTAFPNDGSGYDTFSASLIDVRDPMFGSPSTGIVSVASVYGGRKVAFGTGTTCEGTVTFQKMIASANVGECETCIDRECEPCPGGDGPTGGMQISVSGISYPHNPLCNCTTVNGTYAVPIPGGQGSYFGGFGACTGWGRWYICRKSSGSYFDFRVEVSWLIEATETGWKLRVAIAVYVDWWCGGGAIYERTFSMTDRCDTVSSVPLTFSELIPPTPTNPYASLLGLDWTVCVGWSSLTVTATSF